MRLWTFHVFRYEIFRLQVETDEPETAADDDSPQFGFGGASGGSHTLADEYHDPRHDEVG